MIVTPTPSNSLNRSSRNFRQTCNQSDHDCSYSRFQIDEGEVICNLSLLTRHASGDAPAPLSREILSVDSCIRTPLCTVPILSFFMLLLQRTDFSSPILYQNILKKVHV